MDFRKINCSAYNPLWKYLKLKSDFFFKYGYFFVRWRSFMLSCRKESSINTFNWQLQLSLFIFARRFQFFNNFQEIFRPLNLSIPFFSLESNRNWILIADKHATWLSTTWLLIDLIEYCTISIAVQLEKLYTAIIKQRRAIDRWRIDVRFIYRG